MPPESPAAELARRLAREAEAVCRHYLANGHREGGYWLVGDVANTPGRSLYVRLRGPLSGRGAAGNWTDAATDQYGDLLDLIRLNRGLGSLRDALDEARQFLRLPQPEPRRDSNEARARARSPEAARRLFAMSEPTSGTIAESYLRQRCIDLRQAGVGAATLRFHPRCFYRDPAEVGTRAFPALIAAVTDSAGAITAVHRTWLDSSGRGKAPVAAPRKSLGPILGHGVRFGAVPDGPPSSVMVAGEGLETILSLRMVLPDLPMIAALSANHLGGFLLPPSLRRLYIAADGDAAGRCGMQRLSWRAQHAGIEILTLCPALGDFNEDLRQLGPDALVQALLPQFVPADAARFLPLR